MAAVERLEAVEVFDAQGELDGYALVEVPRWYKGGAHYTDAQYRRLIATAPKPLTPVRSTRSSAWADADRVVEGLTGMYYTPTEEDRT